MQSYALTIEQAWDAAKAYDPNYQKAQISEKIGEANVRSSRSELLPELSLGASSDWDWHEHGQYSNGYNVTLNQVLWDSSKWSKLDAAEASALESQLRGQQAHNDLAEKLITAYLDLAKTQGDLRLAEQKRKESAKMLNVIEQNYKAGKVMSTEFEDTRANQLDIEATLLARHSDLEQKKADLAALISHFPQQVDEISTKNLTQPQMVVEDQGEWLTLAKNNSPELLAAKQKLRSVEFKQEQAQSGYYPTVTGRVMYSDNDKARNDDLSANISLNLPLDLNGATRANVDLAKLDVMQAKQDVRLVEINIKQLIQSRFNQIDLDWQRVEMAQRQISSREKALESKQMVYKAGLAEASDVITAHNNLFDSRNLLQSLLYQYWLHRVELLKSVGQLNDDAVKQISRALQS
ncbi:TolC family protein [uncultured Photobacterium sp.]|uniref:TolC family protein n=1 Tax=uncultured Photobacterium sp. TaxID=173973 RepID=UPI00261C5F34|nr:TolC family protein [uncultured Photobacterium sp.]